VHELVTNLLSSYKFYSNSIDLDISIDKIELNVDLAVNLGLILNELVSNSLKYAFPEGSGGEGDKCILQVKLYIAANSKLVLIVKDNGVGFPEGLDFRNTDSLGMQIVISLVSQCKADILLERKKGTKFTITF
jgi:two-component sensor histidine kinase